MKKKLAVLFLMSVFFSTAHAQHPKQAVESLHSFETTSVRLEKAIQEAGLSLFSKIDHRENAQNAGMKMDSCTVFIFGNPKAGTLLMQENPAIAAELPLKITVYKSGIVWLLYDQPTDWAISYGIIKQKALLEKIEQGLEGIVTRTAN